jgi:hypothetical protein
MLSFVVARTGHLISICPISAYRQRGSIRLERVDHKLVEEKP